MAYRITIPWAPQIESISCQTADEAAKLINALNEEETRRKCGCTVCKGPELGFGFVGVGSEPMRTE